MIIRRKSFQIAIKILELFFKNKVIKLKKKITQISELVFYGRLKVTFHVRFTTLARILFEK